MESRLNNAELHLELVLIKPYCAVQMASERPAAEHEPKQNGRRLFCNILWQVWQGDMLQCPICTSAQNPGLLGSEVKALKF